MIAAILFVGLVACVAPPEAEPITPAEAPLVDDGQAAPIVEATGDELSTALEDRRPADDPDLCCSGGYYRCPTTGATFDYEALACSWGPRRTAMAARCDRACAAKCIDSGWLDPCP